MIFRPAAAGRRTKYLSPLIYKWMALPSTVSGRNNCRLHSLTTHIRHSFTHHTLAIVKTTEEKPAKIQWTCVCLLSFQTSALTCILVNILHYCHHEKTSTATQVWYNILNPLYLFCSAKNKEDKQCLKISISVSLFCQQTKGKNVFVGPINYLLTINRRGIFSINDVIK